VTDPASVAVSTKKTNQALQFIMRLGLFLLALAPLVYTVYREWGGLTQALTDINWLLLGLAFLALLISLPLMAGIGWTVLRWFRAGLPLKRVFGIYFVSQLPKYLPGGVWAFPSRVILYQQAGMENRLSIYAVVREVGALFIGAALVGVSGLFNGLALSPALRLAIGGGTLACVIMLLATQIPVFWRWVAEFRWINLKPLMRFMPIDEHYQDLRWFPPALAASLIFWLAMGLPFRWLAIAVNPDAAALTWLQHAAVFALAWCAGFVVLFSPAGLGIRETALSLLLGQWIPIGDALAIALLSRLCWIAAEGLLIGLSLQWIVQLKKGSPPPGSGT